MLQERCWITKTHQQGCVSVFCMHSEVKGRHWTQKPPLKDDFHVRHASRRRKDAEHENTSNKDVFPRSAYIQGEEKVPNSKTHRRWCVFVFGVHPGWRKGVERENTPTTVFFRARRASGWKERCRTRKYTNEGVFPCSPCIGVTTEASNTKTHRQGCFFVFGVHRGWRKGAEHENTPTRVFFHVRHSAWKSG